MDSPRPYPTADALQTILTELQQDEHRRAQMVREYDQIRQNSSLSAAERRRALAPIEAHARAAEDALWQAYFDWRGEQVDDLQSERGAIHSHLRGGYLTVDPSIPPTIEHIRLACTLIWIYGEDALHICSGVFEVWKYLKMLVDDRSWQASDQQKKAADDLLKQLAQRTLPDVAKGPYSDERASLWIPAMRQYYERELPKIRDIFQKNKTATDRAQALHTVYPDIPTHTFREWIAPDALHGNPLPPHHTAILMTRRVAAWKFGMESAESFRQLLYKLPKPPTPQPAWRSSGPVPLWPRLSVRVLRRHATRQWAIQRALGPGVHVLGEEVLTFDAKGIAVTRQWSTVEQALHFPEMFRVKPLAEEAPM